MDPITLAAIISAGSSLAGGALSGAGQGQMNAANRQHDMAKLLAQLTQQGNQFEQSREDTQTRQAFEGSQQTPNRVGWRQNQAIMNAIMPTLRNVSVQAPMGMGAYVPQISGGLRIPEGGFGPETLKFFSEGAMLAGEEDLDMANAAATGGRAVTPNYGAVYGRTGVDASGRVSAAADRLKSQDYENAMRRRTAIGSALSTAGAGSRR